MEVRRLARCTDAYDLQRRKSLPNGFHAGPGSRLAFVFPSADASARGMTWAKSRRPTFAVGAAVVILFQAFCWVNLYFPETAQFVALAREHGGAQCSLFAGGETLPGSASRPALRRPHIVSLVAPGWLLYWRAVIRRNVRNREWRWNAPGCASKWEALLPGDVLCPRPAKAFCCRCWPRRWRHVTVVRFFRRDDGRRDGDRRPCWCASRQFVIPPSWHSPADLEWRPDDARVFVLSATLL